MILVDWQIKKLCEDKEVGKGLVEPFNPELINPQSIDILLGDTIMVEDPNEKRGHSLFKSLNLVDEGFSLENPYWMEPGEFLLVCSLETFNLPPTICAEFKLKSSRAREGYDCSMVMPNLAPYGHAKAGFCDGGWNGSKLTMELKNNLRYSNLPIYPGLRIGQIIFYKTDLPEKPYNIVGRYNNDQTVMSSKG